MLAYSGGLDTSVTIRWLGEQGYDVHAVAVDVGPARGLRAGGRARAARRAPRACASSTPSTGSRARYLTRAIRANGLYEGKYPMVSGLARPLIADEVVARGARGRRHDARARLHRQGERPGPVRGLVRRCSRPTCEVARPDPRRRTSRARRRSRSPPSGGSRSATSPPSYSVDENLWGRTAECGPLEDPWVAPPEDAFERTAAPADRPSEPAEVVVAFVQGVPVALDGEARRPAALVRRARRARRDPTGSGAST